MPSTDDPLDPFAPATPDQLAAKARSRAQKSVQSSLFRHLGTKGFGRAGHLSWLLCFAADPSTVKGRNARAKLAERTVGELRSLLAAAQACAKSSKADDAWRDFARDVVEAITHAMAIVGASVPKPDVVFAEDQQQKWLDRYEELVAGGMDIDAAVKLVQKESGA